MQRYYGQNQSQTQNEAQTQTKITSYYPISLPHEAIVPVEIREGEGDGSNNSRSPLNPSSPSYSPASPLIPFPPNQLPPHPSFSFKAPEFQTSGSSPGSSSHPPPTTIPIPKHHPIPPPPIPRFPSYFEQLPETPAWVAHAKEQLSSIADRLHSASRNQTPVENSTLTLKTAPRSSNSQTTKRSSVAAKTRNSINQATKPPMKKKSLQASVQFVEETKPESQWHRANILSSMAQEISPQQRELKKEYQINSDEDTISNASAIFEGVALLPRKRTHLN